MTMSTISSRISRRWSSRPSSGAVAVAAICAATVTLAAQSIDPSQVLTPAKDSWPSYHGDYSGRRHSALTQITPDNVKQLGLAWVFQSGRPDQVKASPIVVNGVIYITTPDHLWALDARSGRQIWHYTHPENQAFHIGHRGAAVYGDLVYLTTPDAYLVALNAKDGKVRWKVTIADWKKGYWSTMAPLLIRNHLLVGVSGDFDNLPGILQSFDPETGKLQWTFYSTGDPKETDNGKKTKGLAMGGQMWMTGTY